MRQAKPGLSRKLKGAYPWNNPFIKVAEQACGTGAIRVTKPCEANLRAAVKRTRFGLVNLMGVASLSKRIKPVTDGEATGECNRRALRGGWGRRVRKDKSRNLGYPRVFFRRSRTAHSSGEAGNDRGAKGLNGNMPL